MKKLFLVICIIFAFTTTSAQAYKAYDIGSQIQAMDGSSLQIFTEVMIVDTTTYTLMLSHSVAVVDMTAPGTWKAAMVAEIIAQASLDGFPGMTSADIWLLSYEQGNYKTTALRAVWTKDKTFTNIPATYTNVYAALGGEQQLVDFSGYTQYRFSYTVNKIGNTGTHTAALVDGANAANVIALNDATAVVGEHAMDSGWLDLPAWAVGEKTLKPMAKDPLATGDDIYHGFQLYLK